MQGFTTNTEFVAEYFCSHGAGSRSNIFLSVPGFNDAIAHDDAVPPTISLSAKMFGFPPVPAPVHFRSTTIFD
jgi:hypothetical protein